MSSAACSHAIREDEGSAPPYAGITYVVACGAQKSDRPVPARELYQGQMFRHTLANAERSARMDTEEFGCPARVLILSAQYGLVGLDHVTEPYEQRMDATGSVSATTIAEQAETLGIGWGSPVYALLPRPYLQRLDEALRTLHVYVQDVYDGCGGIGEQRRVNASIGRPTGPQVSDGQAGPGPQVWIGGDVSAFWWGTQILVSYERLRDAKTLPVATAPWVLDSGAYRHLEKHRTWTVPMRQYAADVRCYAEQIGQLVWAAPQDWPANRRTLNATGRSEQEHQAATIASVRHLRAADTGVHVLAVLTAETPIGFLRHLAMYRQIGIDLRNEPIVGVGAMLGRPPGEAAEIVRLLHAAGLTRLHVFGGKGRLLELVGDLIASVDSAGWSDEARRLAGLCPHGLVRWERNCPQAARQWAQRQRDRAARAYTHPHSAEPLVDLWGPVLDDLLVVV